MAEKHVDVIIIGGGPAGLSAALLLGRGVKRVLLCDGAPRRNQRAAQVHNFVTRDGTPPDDFRSVARQQLEPYDVRFDDRGVSRVAPRSAGGFEVTLHGGDVAACDRILLATGMVDDIVDLPGISQHWGRSVFQCPYCHGWEFRGQPWGVLATDVAPRAHRNGVA